MIKPIFKAATPEQIAKRPKIDSSVNWPGGVCIRTVSGRTISGRTICGARTFTFDARYTVIDNHAFEVEFNKFTYGKIR